MELINIPALAICQSGELLTISKAKFDLKACPVKIQYVHRLHLGIS